MKLESHFSLPPSREFYYAEKHPDYKVLPPMHPDCGFEGEQHMPFIYPKDNEGIMLPKDFDEEVNDVIFKIAHRNPDTKVFWYLNEEYIGETQSFHELAVTPSIGQYTLTIVDSDGNEIKKQIEISRS